MVVIKNCRLVAALTEGFSEEYADICIEGKCIKWILPAGQHPEHCITGDEKAEVVDGKGRTLIPGLFEMHAHLYGFIFNPYELQCMDAGKIIFGALDFANEYLRQGFTTIRDCGSSYNCAASIRDAISAGIIKGPRIVSCGLIITPTETGNDTFSDLYAEADGAEETVGSYLVTELHPYLLHRLDEKLDLHLGTPAYTGEYLEHAAVAVIDMATGEEGAFSLEELEMPKGILP